ncbi:eotaxin-like [Hemitrygon akajei]|uniref:eotaxin-like n=1 Tax=Hemitrygon akajei TaxID=2704970 RepID=UPI003BFA2BED
MKAAFHIVILLTALGICFQCAAAVPQGPIVLQCCENFKTTIIPNGRLKSYVKASWCSTPAVIFTNKQNMKICTKASEEWVKNAVKYLDRKQKGGSN